MSSHCWPLPTYNQVGKGDTLLYIPGMEGTGKMLYRQIDDLSRDHKVITFPLRQEGSYGIRRLIDDIEWILSDSNSVNVTVLAESFGGLVAMAAAIERPGVFRRMILLNTFPRFAQRAKITFGVMIYLTLPYSWLKAYRTNRSRNELFGHNISSEDRARFHSLTAVVAKGGYLSRLKIIRGTDLRPQLKEIKIPTLVVAGREDALFNSVAYAHLIVDGIPNSELKILENCGHVALLAPEIKVRDWIDELNAMPASN